MSFDIEKLNKRLDQLESTVLRLEKRPPMDLTQFRQLESLLVLATAAQSVLREKYPAIYLEIAAGCQKLKYHAQQEGDAGADLLFPYED